MLATRTIPFRIDFMQELFSGDILSNDLLV